MSVDPQFEKKVALIRAGQVEMTDRAKKVHPGALDFSSYAQVHDPRYTGFQGSLYLGRPCKNDSSSNITVAMKESSGILEEVLLQRRNIRRKWIEV